jgi:hypothetical protein
MSNRTNRTLSANTNRLNLGTRSFALLAGANNGSTNKTLRLRLAQVSHPGAVARVDRMRLEPAILMPAYSPAMPDSKRGPWDADPSKRISDSSPRSSWPSSSLWGCGTRGGSQGQVVAELPPSPSPVVVIDVPSGRQVFRQVHPVPQAQPRPAASARACRPADLASRSARPNARALASAVTS